MNPSSEVVCEIKQKIQVQGGGFSHLFQELKKQGSSGHGWIKAQCPFHDDKKPSFAFEASTGNWICHAGCGKGDFISFRMKSENRSFAEVTTSFCDELGVRRDLATSSKEILYSYFDEGGVLQFQMVKGPGKRYRQRQPDTGGGWIWNLKGVARILYRLPELLARQDEMVYITEGEKDADRLTDAGLLATTSPGGAGKWRAKYSATLSARDVVILPDNDVPGQKHAQDVAESLLGIARSVKVLKLPDLPEKGDISDWLNAGGSKDQLIALVDEASAWALDIQAQPKPRIQLSGSQLNEVIGETWKFIHATNDPPELFRSAVGLTRIEVFNDAPRIVHLDEPKAYGVLIRKIDWFTQRKNEDIAIKPPKEVARDILANPDPNLPQLDTVLSTPVFDKEWKLIEKPGYHPDSKAWFHPPRCLHQFAIPTKPSDEEVARARSLILDDLLCDFPFTADSDRAHAVAALLLSFARRMFDGPTPMHLIEAPTPGSGKSLLAELIGLIVLGITPSSTTLTTNEEENRKKLTAILSRGASVISIDNLQGGLWSAQVASAITAEYWEDRMLGQTQMVTFPNRALWMVSANNPKLSMEIARRCIRIRLDAGEERPWLRTGFKHDPIRDWAKENRHELVTAILTLIQSWIVSGAPFAQQKLGSFELWSQIIGGMIQHMGLPGFLDDSDEFYEAADSESSEWQAFVQAWWDEHQTTPVSARKLLQLAEDRDLVAFAYAAKSEQSQRARFGRSLSGLRDRRFGDNQVVLAKDSHKKIRTFRLVPVEKGLFS